MSKTKDQYEAVISTCKNVFSAKNADYGPSWTLFRPSSLTDQLFIKAQRIRNIESSGSNNVGDNIYSEFMGIVNYSIMAMIQSEENNYDEETSLDTIISRYDYWAQNTLDLMLLKNSDYSEVWREMRISSFTDMILVKLLRIKQIEDNKGKTIASEGAVSNYQDIMNYAIFALIRIDEKNEP